MPRSVANSQGPMRCRHQHLDGVELEYDVVGSGEPLLLIHGGLIADAFFPQLAEPRIASSYRVISYHRRGYAGSSRTTAPFTIRRRRPTPGPCSDTSASHARMWLITPTAVPLPSNFRSTPPTWQGAWHFSIRHSFRRFHRGRCSGKRSRQSSRCISAAIARGRPTPSSLACWDRSIARCSRSSCRRERSNWLSLIATPAFQVELEALQQSSFTAENAAPIRQPVLSVVGEESEPIFHEIHSVLQQWIPHAEELVVPQANHALEYMNPRAVADGLARFLDRHHL